MDHAQHDRGRPVSLWDGPPGSDSRFLSIEGCRTVADRIIAMATGGDTTSLTIDSRWTGNLRWSRNAVKTGGDTQEPHIQITRIIRGAAGSTTVNGIEDDLLRSGVGRAEEFIQLNSEDVEKFPAKLAPVLPHTNPKIWFDTTYAVEAEERGKVAERLIAPAEAAGLSAAGYLQVSGIGAAVIDTQGLFRYYPYTTAQYSVTVRDPKASASGWAGLDFNDWTRIDTDRLTAIAMDKCVRSRNPVAVEPGRFTAILEPQAMCDLLAPLFDTGMMERQNAERGMGPWAKDGSTSKIGQLVLDRRLTLGADPMDPDCGFVPFDWRGEPYRAVNWIENGVLKDLAYPRNYGRQMLGHDWALPDSRAFRLSGGTTSIEQMISETKRGIYVTRFNNVVPIDMATMLCGGNTRDGLWLIENGKIAKAIKNFRFTESPLFILNNVESLGVPQRTFRPNAPAVCPPVRVRDFSFTALMDAV